MSSCLFSCTRPSRPRASRCRADGQSPAPALIPRLSGLFPALLWGRLSETRCHSRLMLLLCFGPSGPCEHLGNPYVALPSERRGVWCSAATPNLLHSLKREKSILKRAFEQILCLWYRFHFNTWPHSHTFPLYWIVNNLYSFLLVRLVSFLAQYTVPMTWSNKATRSHAFQ